MIHYHGTPITPSLAAVAVLTGRHAMVSFRHPDQLPLAAEVCQSFALDNGAFSCWRAGDGEVDVPAYLAWVREWERHPGFDWCLIPDVIDGDEADNDRMLAAWFAAGGRGGVPVWHLHESFDRLERLCNAYPRVALGSSGIWQDPGTDGWWDRMNDAMAVVCPDGRPRCKLHGLRMLDPTIFSALPMASADSCNVARNIGIDSRWDGHMYLRGLCKADRAKVMAARIEAHAAASTWSPRTRQMNFELLG